MTDARPATGQPARSLIITSALPWPSLRFGGPQRSALILDALSQLGEVDLLLVHPPDAPEESTLAGRDRFRIAAEYRVGPVPPSGPWRHLLRAPSAPVRRLASLLSDIEGRYQPDPTVAAWLRSKVDDGTYDLVVCRHLRPARLAGADRLPDIPRILDSDDIDWRMIANQIQTSPWPGWKGKSAAALALRTSRKLSDSATRRFDTVWVASEEDRSAITSSKVRILPNVPFRPPGSPPIEPCPHRTESRQIFCVGELSYAPNRDGIDHFVRHVWPLVRLDEPTATLQIAGGGLHDDTKRRWSAVDGITVSGFVEDLRHAYNQAAFTIAPIYWGGGTKIKVIESLAHGRTCVATPHALHGYGAHLRHGEGIWRGDTDASMAEGCVRLLRDPGLRTRMAEVGHQIVASRFSVEAFREEVIATCRSLLERQPP